MSWKKGDVLRLKCGWGVCFWQNRNQPKLSNTTVRISDTLDWACTKSGRSHECTVVMLTPSEEGVPGEFFGERGWENWYCVSEFGVGYFHIRKEEMNSHMEKGIIRIVG